MYEIHQKKKKSFFGNRKWKWKQIISINNKHVTGVSQLPQVKAVKSFNVDIFIIE